MRRLTTDELRRRTLQRQFPKINGTDPESVLELFTRLGPIQSQVPRAPFLAVSSRLPGVPYSTICDLFEQHRLLKTTNIRGTVHTSTREHFAMLDAVARRTRAAQLRNYLKLDQVTPEQIATEVEAFTAADWRARADIVAHLRTWLTERDSVGSASLRDTLSDSLLWGHSGLLRRPRDERWEKRTDIFHRRARSVVPELTQHQFDEALAALVRVHLGSYGPATRDDLAFFFGTTLGAVDTAVKALGENVVRLPGPDRDDYLDLAEPPTEGGEEDPGLRLLPEFDGLLVGYAGKHRTRFLEHYQLPAIWAKVNGLFAPIVLYGGHIVASWKTLTRSSRTAIEVRMLDPHPRLAEDLFSDAILATEAALAVKVADLQVLAGD